MARAQFGGAQDNSSLFAAFYNEYERRNEQLAQNADQRARADQQAQDQDEINKWKSGAISDDEFLAYAQERAKDPLNNPSDTTYWRQAIRDVKASVKQRQVNEGAQSIINGIYNGTKSYGDLLAYYQNARKGLLPNDPLYQDITDQMNSVRRQMATSRGSGSGGSTKAINQTIDGLQYISDVIKSASDQFDAGHDTATVGIIQKDGSVRYQTIQIRNPDGTPTADMQALDQQALDTWDQLAKAHTAKGDLSAAGSDLAKKATYISSEIQPRNTIGPQNQMAALYQSLQSAVANAANSIDPSSAWWQVQAVNSQIQQWSANLNTHTEYGKAPSEKQASQNPELNAASRKYGVANAAQDQTTSDFAAKAKTLAELSTAMSAPDEKTGAVIQQAIKGLFAGADPTSDSAKTATNIFQGGAAILSGIAAGTYALTYTSQDGYAWRPLKTIAQGPDVNGVPQYSVVPVDAKGQPIFNPDKGYGLVHTSIDINGKAVPVLAEATQINVYNGQIVTKDTKIPKGESATQMTQVSLPDPGTGQNHFWYQDPSSGMWSRDGLSSSAPSPLPYQGKDLGGAQKIANDLGLDPTGAYFVTAHGALSHGYGVLAGQDWFLASQQDSRAKAQQASLDRVAQGPQHGFTATQGVPQGLDTVKQTVNSLGFGDASSIGKRPISLQSQEFALPNVPNVTAPQINLPKLNLPSLSSLPQHVAPTPTFSPSLGRDMRGGVLQ